MRQGGPNGRRPRGRHHSNGGGGGNGGGGPPPGPMNGGGNNRPRSASSLRHQTFDSNGPDVRVRGNAWQVYEKYQTLARDAASASDRVAAENYQQHAEHYYRIIEAINEATAAEQRQQPSASRPPQPFGQQPEVPANYYGPDGNLMPSPAATAGANPPAPAEAEVQMRTPPQSSFFAPEESDESNAGPEPLVARR